MFLPRTVWFDLIDYPIIPIIPLFSEMKVYFCEGKRRKRNREDPHPNLGLQIGDSAPGRVGTSSFSGVDRLDISLFQNSTQPSRFKPDLIIGLFHVGSVMRGVSVVRMVC